MGGCAECPNGQLHERVGQLEQGQARVTAVLEGIKDNLDRLVEQGERQIRLEERQQEDRKAIDRAFGAIEQLGKTTDVALDKVRADVATLKADAPKNRIASDWVFRVVEWAVAGIIGAAVILYFFPG